MHCEYIILIVVTYIYIFIYLHEIKHCVRNLFGAPLITA